MAFYDIITPADIARDAINSLSIDVTDDADVVGLGADVSYKDVALEVIANVSAMIDTYLNRKVIVDQYDVDTWPSDWEYNDNLGKYFHYAVWPVVEVDTAGATISRDGKRILSGEVERKLDYYAGYRRSGQDLTAIQVEHADLGTLPSVVPADIRRVCQRIVMYELGQAINNTYAEKQRTQNIGQANAEVVQVDQNFVSNELMKLKKYQVLVV